MLSVLFSAVLQWFFTLVLRTNKKVGDISDPLNFEDILLTSLVVKYKNVMLIHVQRINFTVLQKIVSTVYYIIVYMYIILRLISSFPYKTRKQNKLCITAF